MHTLLLWTLLRQRLRTPSEDETSEEKICDTSCFGFKSVQESVGEADDLSRAHSRETQEWMMRWPDRRSRLRSFETCEEVLPLLPQPVLKHVNDSTFLKQNVVACMVHFPVGAANKRRG